jgi:hypothetical protein
MPPLKATQAIEINKSDLTEAETLVFEGRVLSQTGKQTMEPGEFYFRPTAVPITTQPHWFKRLFGAKPKEDWRFLSTVVIACPYCAMPILTTPSHKIERRTPLTISQNITCPYAPNAPHSFKVVEGNITIA